MNRSRRMNVLEFLAVVAENEDNGVVKGALQLSKIVMPDVKLSEAQREWVLTSLRLNANSVSGTNEGITLLATYINSCG